MGTVPLPVNCRHCGAALPAPLRAGGVCGAAGCRHREDRARWAALSQRLGEPARQAAARKPGGPATLLWLRATETRLVPVPKATRAAHRAHLMALIQAAPDAAVQPLAEPAPPASVGEQAWRLCAQCRGLCCTHGGPTHAFITLAQLLRWQRREPGRTLQQAVDWYTAAIPARHARRSCIYHGAMGCTLPQPDRADVCNSYACDSLVKATRDLQKAPQTSFVAITLDGDRPVRQALITGTDTQPLPLRPRRRAPGGRPGSADRD